MFDLISLIYRCEPVAPSSFRKHEIPFSRHITVAPHLCHSGNNNGGPTIHGGGGDGGGDPGYRIGLHFSPFDKATLESSSPKHIFITGATGRIGRFLVAHLLQQTTHRISCLVRNPAHLQLPRSLKSVARSTPAARYRKTPASATPCLSLTFLRLHQEPPLTHRRRSGRHRQVTRIPIALRPRRLLHSHPRARRRRGGARSIAGVPRPAVTLAVTPRAVGGRGGGC